jgi:hypothetical protein
MIDPNTRDLYDYARENYPEIYGFLCGLDAELAALHLSGMDLQRHRLALLEDLREGLCNNLRVKFRLPATVAVEMLFGLP